MPNTVNMPELHEVPVEGKTGGYDRRRRHVGWFLRCLIAAILIAGAFLAANNFVANGRTNEAGHPIIVGH